MVRSGGALRPFHRKGVGVSLISKAKTRTLVHNKGSHSHEYNQDEIDLAIAWACDEVTITQAGYAFDLTNNASVTNRLAYTLREAFRRDQIQKVDWL